MGRLDQTRSAVRRFALEKAASVASAQLTKTAAGVPIGRLLRGAGLFSRSFRNGFANTMGTAARGLSRMGMLSSILGSAVRHPVKALESIYRSASGVPVLYGSSVADGIANLSHPDLATRLSAAETAFGYGEGLARTLFDISRGRFNAPGAEAFARRLGKYLGGRGRRSLDAARGLGGYAGGTARTRGIEMRDVPGYRRTYWGDRQDSSGPGAWMDPTANMTPASAVQPPGTYRQ